MNKLLSILFLLIPVLLYASNEDAKTIGDSCFERNVIQQNVNDTFFSLSFSEPDLITSDDSEGFYYQYLGEGRIDIPSHPVVPTLNRFVRLHETGGVHVEIEAVNFRTVIIENYTIADGSSLDDLENTNVSEEGFFPANLVNIGDPAILRDFRVASISVAPVQVNSESGEVRIYDQIDFKVVRDESSSVNELQSTPTTLSQTFLPIYQQFLDWELDELDDYEVYQGGICVVAPATYLNNNLVPWLEWKKQKGYEIITLLANQDSYQLASSIQSAWDIQERKWDHLIIVGDENDVPPMEYWEEHGIFEYGDLRFATLSGGDDLVDCSLSRISVQNNLELEAYVDKVIQYEKYPLVDDVDWYRKFLANNSQVSYELTQYGMEEAQGSDFESIFNEGLSFIFRSNLFDAEDFFTNYRKYPVIISPGGDWNTYWFYDEASFSESFIRADSSGAIAVYSSGELIENELRIFESINIGAVRAIQVNSALTFGDVYLGGIYQYHRISSERGWRPDYFNRPLLMGFGDASVWLYTDVPRILEVSTPDSIDTGRRNNTISVLSSDEPVSGAWVTLFRDEDQVFRTITDDNGVGILESNFNANGTAILTITAPNSAPYIDTLNVNSSSRIETDITELIDDGSLGTSGNGNGIPDWGETIGIRLLINNRENGIDTLSIVPELAEGYMDSTWGAIERYNIPQNSNFITETLLYFRMSEIVPDQYYEQLHLSVNQDGIEYLDIHHFVVDAPYYNFNEVVEDLQPGITDEVRFVFSNLGSASGVPSIVRISMNDPWVNVLTEELSLQTILPGGTQQSSPCMVSVSSEAFRGYRAAADIEIEFDNGRIDTLYANFSVGTVIGTDPSGPDRYGYYAYDCIDHHVLRPTYDWIEIDPNQEYDFQGQPLSESVLSLPFDFVYYGESFNQIKIGSSGWISPGNPSCSSGSNYGIPSPIGPPGMIAPAWGVPSYYVHTYILEEERKVIIQWKGQAHQNINIYQVILDCNGDVENPDSDIIFQYNDVTFPSTYDWESRITYPTIGVENFTQDDGLSLRYKYGHRQGTATIDDGSAIRISTRIATESGFISGIITHTNDSTPVVGVRVMSDAGGFIDTTDSEGYYRIEIPTGHHHLILSKDGYPDIITDMVSVADGQEVVLNHHMLRALIEVNPLELNIHIDEGENVTEYVDISNEGDFDLTFSTEFLFDDPEIEYTGEIGHHLFSIPMSGMIDLVQAEDMILGLRSGWSGDPFLKQFNEDGEEVGSILLNTQEVYYNLDYLNGKVLLRSDMNIYICESQDDELVILRESPLPIEPINEILFNAEDQLYIFSDRSLYSYVVDTGTLDLILSDVSFDGEGYADDVQYYRRFSKIRNRDYSHIFSTLLQGTSPFGDYYYSTKYYYFNEYTGEHSQIRDVPTTETPYFFISNKNNGIVSYLALFGWDYHHIWFSEFQVEDSWIDFQPEQDVVLEPGNSNSIPFTINPVGMDAGMYETWLSIRNSTVNDRVIVPITIYYQVTDVPSTPAIPSEWSLEKIYPNPFNPSTNVEFALVEQANVKVKLFNIMGQEVLIVFDQNMQAGYQTVTVDGSRLASGVYFLEFNAGPVSEVRKVVLLK